MKKIYSLIIVAVAALTFACCGNANKKAAAETEATETVETVVEDCDSTKCCGECCEGDSTAAANTEAAEVVEQAAEVVAE